MRAMFTTLILGTVASGLLLLSGCVPADPILPNDADADGLADNVDPNPSVPTAQTLGFDGRNRRFTLRLPAGYDPATATPLVLVLHGTGQSASAIRSVARFDTLADNHGFMVAYPEGVGLNWNDGREVPGVEAYDQNVDDVGFLAALSDLLADDYNTDPARTYVTGFSNGGIMAYRLALETPERYAGFAPIAAALPTQFENYPAPAAASPMIIFNSTDDRVLPYAGGTLTYLGVNLGTFISVENSVLYWTLINNTVPQAVETPLPNTANDGCTVTKFIFAPGPDEAPVVFFRIVGGGHNWPGGPATQAIGGGGPVCRDIDASALIWEFFSGFSRP